jgi:hypothetical protein
MDVTRLGRRVRIRRDSLSALRRRQRTIDRRNACRPSRKSFHNLSDFVGSDDYHAQVATRASRVSKLLRKHRVSFGDFDSDLAARRDALAVDRSRRTLVVVRVCARGVMVFAVLHQPGRAVGRIGTTGTAEDEHNLALKRGT